jgi:MscS family membrane protein
MRTHRSVGFFVSTCLGLLVAFATASADAQQTTNDPAVLDVQGTNALSVDTTNAPEDLTAVVPQAVRRAGDELISSLSPTLDYTPPWAWLALFLAILCGVVLGKLGSTTLNALARRMEDGNARYRAGMLRAIAGPLNLLLITLGIAFGLMFVHLDDGVRGIVRPTILLLIMLVTTWFVFNLVDILELVLQQAAGRNRHRIDDYLVPVIARSIRVFILVLFSLVIARNVFGLDVTGWLAGLGIAGLAVSLAAQDSIKNLFGSATVLFDKPFVVGDRIKFDGFDGPVETIGLRATRIRTLEGHLVSVPNMKFIDNSVENVGARPYIRRNTNVTITYDTPAEKIEQAVEILKGILNDAEIAEPFDMENYPPRVGFDEFNADSLNIKVFYWYTVEEGKRDYFTYLEHAQKVNLRIFREFEQAGIEFAFPTQTLYLANDNKRQLAVKMLNNGEQ